ncbi:MAG TPA: cytochrome c biogenesis protein CcsA [Anaeromyxobacteraceae bacterium]|nr:cytochrome c biogenesis protein CcsA [Anaeromyxobacteraceae bacterium]
MKTAKYAAWIAGLLGLVAAVAPLLPKGSVRGFDLASFGRLPVLEGGRVKPIDSVARNALLMIRGHQSLPSQGRSVGASEWLLDVLFRPAVADRQNAFRIDDPDVLGMMGMQQTSARYFSFEHLKPHLDEIQRQASAAHPIDAKQRDRFQAAVVNLFDRIYLYYRLRNTLQLAGSAGLAAEIPARSGPGSAERQAVLVQLAYFRPMLPAPGAREDAFRSVGEALRAARAAPPDPSLEQWARLGLAWSAQDPAPFNAAVGQLTASAQATRPATARHAGQEWTFNRAQPFYAGMVIYVLALLTLFASWAWKRELLQPAAWGLLVAGALVHTVGLVSRIVLQGRPPVTNLYSSAVFVGWAAVVLGVILERIYRRGFGTAVAAVSGFASLIVAHHLMGDGDTMEMMRAVLDSNFWLATHVVTITIGYSGTFLAGIIAIGWTLWHHLARAPDPATGKTLGSMVYGVLAFALFFSFLGTVLGGIWADQSWGRFWGWDPKENGALLIVLWNAIILHTRWGGYARERGIMTMAIFGNVVTSLSWFGVNMLGVGLHSYGFMDKAFWALSGFIASQLLLMGLALAPPQFWKGRAAAGSPATPRASEPA